MPRFNLLKGLTRPEAPAAAVNVGVTVNFDPTASSNKVTFSGGNGTNSGDVSVNTAGNSSIAFTLQSSNMPTGASASIAGVTFPTDTKSGSYAPVNVFNHANPQPTIPNTTPPQKIFGLTTGGGNWGMNDNNNVPQGGPEQNYDYCLWILYNVPNQQSQYIASDPKISNTDPPPGK